MIANNSATYAGKTVSFQHLDITDDALPKADMIMVRDCLFHLKFWLRWAFFENFAKSDIPYLMMTMHHQEVNNALGVKGKFKRFTPRAAPFHFEEPMEMIHETVDSLPEDLTGYPNLWAVRSMGIWSREQIIRGLDARVEREAAEAG